MTDSPKTITNTEAEVLFNYLLRHHREDSSFSVPYRNFLMALIMLDTGIRVGELVLLRQSDLFFNGEIVTNLVIRAEIAKRKRERIIPLSERLKKAIGIMEAKYWAQMKPEKSVFAFYAFHGTIGLHVRQVQRIIKLGAQDCLHRVVTPHMLRHTFGTRLMRTCSTRIVQELLGHKNLSSTQIYTHPNHQDLTNAINSLET